MQHLVGLAAMAAALLTAITADAVPSDGALEFEASGVVYEIPSEYLAQRAQSRQQPALEVTIPTSGPRGTSGRRGWETWFVSAMRHTCATFQFLISGGQGATRRQMADNAAKLPSALRQSAVDQFGYETWWSKKQPVSCQLLTGMAQARRLVLFLYHRHRRERRTGWHLHRSRVHVRRQHGCGPVSLPSAQRASEPGGGDRPADGELPPSPNIGGPLAGISPTTVGDPLQTERLLPLIMGVLSSPDLCAA